MQIVDNLVSEPIIFTGDPSFAETYQDNYNLCIINGEKLCGYYDFISKNLTIYSTSDFDSDGMKHFKIQGIFYGADSSLQL